MQLPTSELAQCRWTLQHQTVQAKPPDETKKFHDFSTLTSACAGHSNRQLQLLLWSLGLCIPIRSRSAQNCAGTYQSFGVDVITLLNLGFDVTDFNSLPLAS